ncbi:DUF5615 family PIN-like protein [Tunicatimonas pelagia]|uniref:DUF5615 family PIN-like protein n=1 Tax=Tunicatimonas pelagia TaxID=931531 RepID=UPI002666546E|nr:DUF5615 family PIN-like protein [Tunicatimonas pelagia]WKN41728.1 DUF5615 family PIN-like protein [Tunicatimonas pelagia]
MPKYLIDVNLPYYFSLWNNKEYVHQIDIEPQAKDKDIWQYAIDNHLIIITKDSDFYNRIIVTEPPPKIIHIRTGNMSMKDFHRLINSCWDEVKEMIYTYKLVIVHREYLEGVK